MAALVEQGIAGAITWIEGELVKDADKIGKEVSTFVIDEFKGGINWVKDKVRTAGRRNIDTGNIPPILVGSKRKRPRTMKQSQIPWKKTKSSARDGSQSQVANVDETTRMSGGVSSDADSLSTSSTTTRISSHTSNMARTRRRRTKRRRRPRRRRRTMRRRRRMRYRRRRPRYSARSVIGRVMKKLTNTTIRIEKTHQYVASSANKCKYAHWVHCDRLDLRDILFQQWLIHAYPDGNVPTTPAPTLADVPDNHKIYIRKVVHDIKFSNTSNVPCILTMYILKTPRDLFGSVGATPEAVLNFGWPQQGLDTGGSEEPMLQPWDCRLFTKVFKIMSYKRIVIREGEHAMFTLTRRKGFIYSQEMSAYLGTTARGLRGLTKYIFFRVEGMPAHEVNDPTKVGLHAACVDTTSFRKYYVSNVISSDSNIRIDENQNPQQTGEYATATDVEVKARTDTPVVT